MLDDVRQHLKKSDLLPNNSNLVIAVSGGVDSVSLLDILSKLADEWGWNIIVAHLNHNIRDDSIEDARLVAGLAERYGHRYYMHQLIDPNPAEAALRKLRYNFLETIRSGSEADYIVTAHHADDRIETSILNVIRGADRYGITALKPTHGLVVRPLLPFNKGQLILYANLNDLEYREDSTNADPRFRRNFVRNDLIPLASMYHPEFRSRQTELIQDLDQLTDQIDWQLSQLLQTVATEQTEEVITLQRDAFVKLPKLVQVNLISYITRQLTGGLALSEQNLGRGVNFLNIAKTGAFSNAIPHLIIERVYDTLVIASEGSQPEALVSALPLKPNQEREVGGFRINLRTKSQPSSSANYLIKPSTLYIRGWQSGDRIAPVGMSGHKKVQDIFTDKKVPRSTRAHWPVVVDARNKPVCVAGLSIDRDALTDPTEPHYQLIVEEIA